MQTQAGSLRVEVKSGIVEISWNEQAFVTGVGLERVAQTESVGTATHLPRRIFQFIEDLQDYFETGKPFSRVTWDDIATDGWSEFQKKVYRATLTIPYGETRTYGWVSMKIGTPLACRAVGQALRKNPVALLVPCHRVVSHQSLGGFMGADSPEAPELDLKRQLLSLENSYVNPFFPFTASIGA